LNNVISFSDASTVTNGTIVSWNWDFGNGTSTLQNPTNTYTVLGLQTVTLIVSTTAGCSDTIVKTIFVNVLPTSMFTTVTFCPDSAEFTESSSIPSGAIAGWSWSFGDTTFSSLQDPTHTYPSSGTFVVTLSVTSDSGCAASFVDTVTVIPCVVDSQIIGNPAVPSAFTPNGDGHNDLLRVKGGPFSDIDFRVFNEWGKQIFRSTSQADGWNGKFKNKAQPEGVYLWTVVGTVIDGKEVKMAGDVTLLR
jgi:gliding motility-associated-like protein